MGAEWHYGEVEPSNGPVSLEELKALVASGQVQPTWMVWEQGMPEWLTAGEVEDLFPKQPTASEPAAGQPPPVLPEPATPASPRKLPSLRTALIGLAAICLVGLVVAGSVVYFHRHKQADQSSQTTEEASQEQKYEDVPENIADAMAVLKTSPSDPGANLAVGQYYCFRKGDWDKGLPMLGQGSDALLKELATAELRKPTAAEDQKKLGDGWWDFAGGKVKLVWKGSQGRAAHWYREALPHLEGQAKMEVEAKLKGLKEQPADFEILARRSRAIPDEERCIVECRHLFLGARRTEKMPEMAGGLSSGLAGLELKGVCFLDLKVQVSPDLGGNGKNVFAGFMVDYQTAKGYTKRVALSIGAFNRERATNEPHWGKRDVPDDFVDLGVKNTYQLDLQEWAPAGWTGRQVWFGLVLQQRTPKTFLTAELVPHATKQQATSKDVPTSPKPEKKDDNKTKP